ncbi:hypothetical protein KTN05_03300 [Paracoccus sp. Z118]|uniref:hypothetical protein n=1 Tax=Paracoccus sp. Z118 TaxID=2851017 RepID=UPI001C2C5730|nr:hypothetical protein [Paracoccus sp. Z118]MBV0890873.1 hypothetical protein [Paracoccus sp. Z118]
MTARPRPGSAGFHRRLRDAAFVVPVFALLLLLPPFLNLFRVGRMLFGIPLEVVYLFAIWTALVAGAFVLSRHLPRQSEIGPEIDPEASTPDSGQADHS